MDYKNKYLKYKLKYLILNNKLTGGLKNLNWNKDNYKSMLQNEVIKLGQIITISIDKSDKYYDNNYELLEGKFIWDENSLNTLPRNIEEKDVQILPDKIWIYINNQWNDYEKLYIWRQQIGKNKFDGIPIETITEKHISALKNYSVNLAKSDKISDYYYFIDDSIDILDHLSIEMIPHRLWEHLNKLRKQVNDDESLSEAEKTKKILEQNYEILSFLNKIMKIILEEYFESDNREVENISDFSSKYFENIMKETSNENINRFLLKFSREFNQNLDKVNYSKLIENINKFFEEELLKIRTQYKLTTDLQLNLLKEIIIYYINYQYSEGIDRIPKFDSIEDTDKIELRKKLQNRSN